MGAFGFELDIARFNHELARFGILLTCLTGAT